MKMFKWLFSWMLITALALPAQAAIITGGTSGVSADTTAAKELFVAAPQDRLTAPSGSYVATSNSMAMATTAANTVVFSIENPAASGKTYYVTRLTLQGSFGGTAAATRQSIAVSRATGTSAGGTGNKTGAAIAKRNPSDANSTAIVRYGPTAITGLTADTAGDFRVFHIQHIISTPGLFELLDDRMENLRNEPLMIAPGTSMAIFTRDNASVAGEFLTINVRWFEL